MYRQKFKALETRVKAQEEENKTLREELEKLKDQNTSKYEGINNKLSDFAQKAIETAKGPLKSDQLLKLIMDDIYGKRKIEALNLIRKKYSKDIEGVRKQLSNILENLHAHVAYRKKQKELDDKFIKILEKFEKKIEEEKTEEEKSGTKLTMQTTMDQFFPGYKVNYKVTHEVNYSNDQNSSKEKGFEEPGTSKQGMPMKGEEKKNRKRKTRTEDESSSSQEDGVKRNASRSSKRLKAAESDEPMSVDPSSTEQMSISEGTSSQSDAMSVDESTESNNHMKTMQKQTGKSSKQPVARFREDASDYQRREETVPERHFNLRGKRL